MLSITGLATNSALTAVENKMPDVASLVTKTDFDAKLKAISDSVTKIKTKELRLDNELKNEKRLILIILWVETILKKMMEHKTH